MWSYGKDARMTCLLGCYWAPLSLGYPCWASAWCTAGKLNVTDFWPFWCFFFWWGWCSVAQLKWLWKVKLLIQFFMLYTLLNLLDSSPRCWSVRGKHHKFRRLRTVHLQFFELFQIIAMLRPQAMKCSTCGADGALFGTGLGSKLTVHLQAEFSYIF